MLRLAVPVAALVATPALTLPGLTAAPAAADETAPTWFERVATYPVFQNLDTASADPSTPTVAEISAVSPDGTTLAYTDAVGHQVGFVDITDPRAPQGLGTRTVGTGSPTSVGWASLPASFGVNAEPAALVTVDRSTYPGLEDTPWEAEAPAPGERAGALYVFGGPGHELGQQVPLAGQPDSITVSPDGRYAAIAIENQRNEAYAPDGLGEGDIPQPPAGSVAIIDLHDPVSQWWSTTQYVDLTEADLAGLDVPGDAEPEFVDINDDNQLVVTLQENNGFAIVDLASASVVDAFSAGTAHVDGVDTTDNGLFDATDAIDAPREPDGVQWVGDGYVATTNEGDWKGGSRGWTVFDAATGAVAWDSGASFENLALAHGHFNDNRADDKGTEPESIAFDVFHGTPFAFVGSERSNFVAVYDMTAPTDPQFVQLLPTTMGPEGLLTIPQRDLLVVSSEEDEAPLVRASLGVYVLGSVTTGYRVGIAGPSYPSIVSDVPAAGAPIGWGALGALSADPADPARAFTASDAAFATPRIYAVDLSEKPAVVDDVIEVTGGETPVTDIEGLVARRAGGFWIANEGTGAGNFLARTDAAGVVQETVPLPVEVSSHVKNWGLEGVTATGSGASEAVYVALQRPLWVDPVASPLVMQEGNVARIGRYLPATGEWSWFTYPLGTTTTAGDWIGLSEITAIDADTFAVIERDKLNGPAAAIKRVYRFDLPAEGGTATQPVAVQKKLAFDVLPVLEAKQGWTQEKLEGLTITGGGKVLAVTDNDGLSDNSGETHLCTLGSLRAVFGHDTTTKASASPRRTRAGRTVTVMVTVRKADGGTVTLKDGTRKVGAKAVDADGVITFQVRRIKAGTHRFRASYGGGRLARPSTSTVVQVVVRR